MWGWISFRLSVPLLPPKTAHWLLFFPLCLRRTDENAFLDFRTHRTWRCRDHEKHWMAPRDRAHLGNTMEDPSDRWSSSCHSWRLEKLKCPIDPNKSNLMSPSTFNPIRPSGWTQTSQHKNIQLHLLSANCLKFDSKLTLHDSIMELPVCLHILDNFHLFVSWRNHSFFHDLPQFQTGLNTPTVPSHFVISFLFLLNKKFDMHHNLETAVPMCSCVPPLKDQCITWCQSRSHGVKADNNHNNGAITQCTKLTSSSLTSHPSKSMSLSVTMTMIQHQISSAMSWIRKQLRGRNSKDEKEKSVSLKIAFWSAVSSWVITRIEVAWQRMEWVEMVPPFPPLARTTTFRAIVVIGSGFIALGMYWKFHAILQWLSTSFGTNVGGQRRLWSSRCWHLFARRCHIILLVAGRQWNAKQISYQTSFLFQNPNVWYWIRNSCRWLIKTRVHSVLSMFRELPFVCYLEPVLEYDRLLWYSLHMLYYYCRR